MADDFAELIESGREPSRTEIAALARTYLVGPIDEAVIDRLAREFRELYADGERRDAKDSDFRANGRLYLGQAWKELLSPHERLPSPAELALWLAIVTPGYPPPRPFCPPELVGVWRQESPTPANWQLDASGRFQTNEPTIAKLNVVRWCVHFVERRGDFYRDRLWLLGNEPHNISPRPLIIRECTPTRLRLLRAGGDFGDIEYLLARAS